MRKVSRVHSDQATRERFVPILRLLIAQISRYKYDAKNHPPSNGRESIWIRV